MDSSSENRRAEYTSLRNELFEADRTCVQIMGFAIAITGAAGGAAMSERLDQAAADFVGWLLSPIWFFAFWYFTEKRFVIIRLAAYIREQIEPKGDGYEWETISRKLSQSHRYRRALPLDPYHLEVIVSGLMMLAVPIAGVLLKEWSLASFYFIASTTMLFVFLVLAVRAWRFYRRPQEYSLASKEENK